MAYRYFSTPRRKFIIADTPGHEQYTRNMATGASTADLAIILVDARQGILEQSRRHAYLASLLGIPHFIVAVNKMDLAGYGEDVFGAFGPNLATLSCAFTGVARPGAYFIPLSALKGDNVVRTTHSMPWFDGPSLLHSWKPWYQRTPHHPVSHPRAALVRPDPEFRGYAGQVASGPIVKPGDAVMALPSGQRSRVKSIETFDGPLEEAVAPMSVTLTLEDEVDISRGDMISSAQKTPDSSAPV